MKLKTGLSKPSLQMYERIRQILDFARSTVARSVNTTQVVANWLIGREIVEEVQKGGKRADYGARLIADLSTRMEKDFGRGYSVNNLEHFRDFYLTYPNLVESRIPHAVRGESRNQLGDDGPKISHAPRGKSDAPPRKFTELSISDAPRRKSPPQEAGGGFPSIGCAPSSLSCSSRACMLSAVHWNAPDDESQIQVRADLDRGRELAFVSQSGTMTGGWPLSRIEMER
ncbi:MAG: DUF1016 N-terminal domain-containing protein [bacterium]